ncbi:MAG: bifunctional metallophosphatase/5'-nucleotidase [Chitinivibrionales bacterium]|nr:bifunctional metallophosphatase/5'-nucleotidase [Chitinivibrionales bacterium]
MLLNTANKPIRICTILSITCVLQLFAGEKLSELALRKLAAKTVSWSSSEADVASVDNIACKILAFNDFHGQIGAGRKVAGRPVGSASVMASYLKSAVEGFGENYAIVHAGDLVGASPPSSSLLQDEPALMFFNALGNQHCSTRDRSNSCCNLVGTLGNHEFDDGEEELMRLLSGGNHKDGPFMQAPWKGAAFPHICANVFKRSSGLPLVAPYTIKQTDNGKGPPVAFIGACLDETPTIVTREGVKDLIFVDEAEAVNLVARIIKDFLGIKAIVLVIHEGGTQSSYGGGTDPDAGAVSGEIVSIINELDDEIDVVITGHRHGFTNALVKNKNGVPMLVTQSWSKGSAYADIDIELSRATGDVVKKSAKIITTWADEGPGLDPDPAIAAGVKVAQDMVKKLTDQKIAESATEISRSQNAAGESALGNLIADAQRAIMGTDFAFMNPGGIRADLDAGTVTWGELYTIQPFANYLIKMELTGQQVKDLLNQQWAGQPYPRMLQISGLSYTWDNSLPADDRVVEILKDDQPLEFNATYTVTVNSFMADGGDNFTVLLDGKNKATGPIDLDALIEYIKALPQPFAASVEGRISSIN